jgi:hypothetical protein
VTFYPHPEALEIETTNVPVNVSENVPENDRQKWFLNQTSKGIRVSSSEFAAHWDISTNN